MKNKILFILFILFSAIGFFCQTQQVEKNSKNQNFEFLKPIEKVIEEYTPLLMHIPGVVGTAIGECDDKPCIKILVKTLSEEIEMKIPPTIEGYPVEIEEVGDVNAF